VIRIDLGKEDGKKRGGSLLGGSLGAAFSKLKGKGGGDFVGGSGLGLGKIKSFVGNLSGVSMLLVVAALSAMPHVVFERYKSYLVDEHQTRVAAIDQKIQQVGSEIEKMMPYKRELESYEAQKKLVRDRITAIQELLAQRAAPVAVLDAIGQSLPQRTWLTDMDLKITDSGATLLLEGRSYSNEDISDYVDRLAESSVLESVDLEAVGQERGDGQGAAEVKSFKIVVKPKGFVTKKPPPPAETTTKAPAKAAGGRATAGAPAGEGEGN
jgi:Tfp pilus assembly protein PilN